MCVLTIASTWVRALAKPRGTTTTDNAAAATDANATTNATADDHDHGTKDDNGGLEDQE